MSPPVPCAFFQRSIAFHTDCFDIPISSAILLRLHPAPLSAIIFPMSTLFFLAFCIFLHPFLPAPPAVLPQVSEMVRLPPASGCCLPGYGCYVILIFPVLMFPIHASRLSAPCRLLSGDTGPVTADAPAKDFSYRDVSNLPKRLNKIAPENIHPLFVGIFCFKSLLRFPLHQEPVADIVVDGFRALRVVLQTQVYFQAAALGELPVWPCRAWHGAPAGFPGCHGPPAGACTDSMSCPVYCA